MNHYILTKAQLEALDHMPKFAEWNEDDLTFQVGIERTEHPLQKEGVCLGSGVVTPWAKPNWPSNFVIGRVE